MSITKELLLSIALQCSPDHIPNEQIALLAEIMSSNNPYLVSSAGVEYSFNTELEAKEKINSLIQAKKQFQIGIMQVHSEILKQNGVDPVNGFDLCKNVQIATKIVDECTIQETKIGHLKDEFLKGVINCYIYANDTGNKNVSLLEQKINKSLYNYTGGKLKESNLNDEKLQDFTTDESRAVIDDNILLPRKHKESWDVFGDF